MRRVTYSQESRTVTGAIATGNRRGEYVALIFGRRQFVQAGILRGQKRYRIRECNKPFLMEFGANFSSVLPFFNVNKNRTLIAGTNPTFRIRIA